MKKLTKSLFLELCRYEEFLTFLAATNSFPDIPDLGVNGFANRLQRKALLEYLQERLDAVEAATDTFMTLYPAFYGVKYAMDKMAAEFSVAQLYNPNNKQRIQGMVYQKIYALKHLLLLSKLSGMTQEKLLKRIDDTIAGAVHAFRFGEKVTDLIGTANTLEETTQALYAYAVRLTEKYIDSKAGEIKRLNDIMSEENTLKSFFDRVVVINLKKRTDRWQQLQQRLKEVNWPFKDPERFEAYDGRVLPRPIGWTSGEGTWGCLLSHREVLGQAIKDGLENVLVLEDDIFFAEDFEQRVTEFIREVPYDWDQIMLGGQYFDHSKISDVTENVRQVSVCHRAHAYAVRGRFLTYMYAKLQSSYGHVDHIMNTFQERYKVYTPAKGFLIGQDGSPSDISGMQGDALMRDAPEKDTPLFLVKADYDLMREIVRNEPLMKIMHTGTLDKDGANASLMQLVQRFKAQPNANRFHHAQLNEWLISNMWYARSVYPAKYFMILNPFDKLVPELRAAGANLNLVYVEKLEDIEGAIKKLQENTTETLVTEFPEPQPQ